jgi:cyclopropane fatty-acyl-phospholipid synthase-like methyltransferase
MQTSVVRHAVAVICLAVVACSVRLQADPMAAVSQPVPAAVARLENTSRAVFRYRVAITSLLELKPGMTVADIGAGSGFIARLMAEKVAPGGRVIATELDRALVSYMEERARADGLQNVSVRLGEIGDARIEPASLDALALVETFSVLERREEMLRSLAAALKPGGLMVIVDAPREGQGATQTGIDAEDVVALATAEGFKRIDESGIVPGDYAIRFRKP